LQHQLEQYRVAHQKSQKLIYDAAKGLKEMRESMTNYGDYLCKGLISKEQFANQRYFFISSRTPGKA